MNHNLPAFLQPLEHGIYAIDTGFHRDLFDAAYLMVHNGRAAFIDTGTNFAVPRLLASLDALGIAHEAVEFVIPTHVHLDHAGGAGLLMQQLPCATLWVHPRGARHMVDPTALWNGALAVYGAEEMQRSYGELVAVRADRVMPTCDGLRLTLGGRELLFADTPGHARHHHCIWDATSRGWFTGDTFGLSYRDFDTARGAWIMPTSTPVQFDPPALAQSIRRLMSLEPECMYLTHYGRVTDVPRLAALLGDLLAQVVGLSQRLQDTPERHQALKNGLLDIYRKSLDEHGCRFNDSELKTLLGVDLELNAQGMAVWLDAAPQSTAQEQDRT